MANVSLIRPTEGGTHPSRQASVKVPYAVERVIDIAELVERKGSALAAGDVIEALKVPEQTVVLGVVIGKITETDATTITMDVDVGATSYIAGYNAKTAAINSIGTGIVSPAEETVVDKPSDVVAVTLATLTGTATEGKFRVIATLTDLSSFNSYPGIAALGS